MSKVILLLLVSLISLNITGYSQTITIKGKVTDSLGNPLSGVNVEAKLGKVGTSTNLQGLYTITLRSTYKTLQFSFVGYLTQEIPLKGRSEIDVVMKTKVASLGEVVVVGYGTQKAESVVGAIAHISGDDLKNGGMVSDISTAMQGQIPGVGITLNTSEPGRDIPNILIRGESTWNGAQPLILVDGVERQMNDVNVNDIANISVLKDASATAVFGVKGANGVILLTTKRGAIGKSRLSFSAHQTLQSPSKVATLMNATDAETWKDVAVAHEVSANPAAWQYYVPQQIIDYTIKPQVAPYSYLYPNVDWQDVMLKKFAKSNQVDMNLSGGTDFVKYFTSMGYVHQGDLMNSVYNQQKGYDPGFSFDRFNFRGNLDFNLTKTTKFSTNVNGYFGTQKGPGANFNNGGVVWPGNNGNDYRFLFAGIYNLAPDAFPVTYPDGIYGIDKTNTGNMVNPYALLEESGVITTNRNHIGTDFILSQQLDAITKGLSFSLKVSFDNYVSSNGPSITDKGNQGQTEYEDIDPSILHATNYADSLAAITKISSQNTPGINQFDYIAQPWYTLTSANGGKGNAEQVANTSLERDVYYQAGLNYDRTFNQQSFSGLFLFSRRQSALGAEFPHFEEDWVSRVTYNYASKYFVEINGAYTGSENFAPKYRFGFFPSGAVGWLISNEHFMQQFTWLDKLKLRASMGSVGSDQGIPRWGYIGSWLSPGPGDKNPSSLFTGPNGIENVPSPYLTYAEGTIANPDLRWETSLKKDLGLEVSALQNRINFVGDLFSDTRSNIFMSASQRNIPVIFGAPPVPANLGETYTTGYEMTLGFRDHITKNFGYNISLSMTGAKDIVKKYEDPSLLPAYQKTTGLPIGQVTTQVGSGYMDNWNAVYASVAPTSNIQYRLPGDLQMIDYNGDGKIDQNDVVPYGHSNIPQNTYSGTLGLNYKNLSLMVQFYSVQNITLQMTPITPGLTRYTSVSSNLANYWTPNNTNPFYPAPRLSTSASTGQFGYYNGAYVSLQTARIAYTFTGNWVQKWKVSGAQIVLSGNNLFFWSQLPSNLQANFNQADMYPLMKQYDLGLQFSF